MTELSEQEVRTRYITPAIQRAGWSPKQIREEFLYRRAHCCPATNDHARAARALPTDALYYKNDLPIAIIEAKKDIHPIGSGMPQALAYGTALDIPFVYSSNGKGFVEHDRTVTGTVERDLGLEAFPNPAALWERYRQWKALDAATAEVVLEEYYSEKDGKVRPATTNGWPSTGPSRPSPRVRSVFCSSWLPGPARPTPPFKSCGGSGAANKPSAFSIWPTMR